MAVPTVLLMCPICDGELTEVEVRYEQCSEDDPLDLEWVPLDEGTNGCEDCGIEMEAV